jgi:chromosome segregation ATPase
VNVANPEELAKLKTTKNQLDLDIQAQSEELTTLETKKKAAEQARELSNATIQEQEEKFEEESTAQRQEWMDRIKAMKVRIEALKKENGELEAVKEIDKKLEKVETAKEALQEQEGQEEQNASPEKSQPDEEIEPIEDENQEGE